MSPEDPVAEGVWRLLEELYLDAASKLAAGKYTRLSETGKRASLILFAKRQAVTSKRWSRIIQDLLSVDLDGWRQNPVTIAAPPRGASPAPSTRRLHPQ
jgi:hypothetical protein